MTALENIRMAEFSEGMLKELSDALIDDQDWLNYLSNFETRRNKLHLAVMVEPYLRLCLERKKTIESRFSTRRIAPYRKVRRGDVILMKRPGGPIAGICGVANAWFYELDPTSWRMIKNGFMREIYASPQFWTEHEAAAYATLIRLQDARSIEHIDLIKRDKRGWVVLGPRPDLGVPEDSVPATPLKR